MTTADTQRLAAPDEVYTNMNDILLASLQDPVVRDFILTEALKRITYDYEVVYGMVKHDQPRGRRTGSGPGACAAGSRGRWRGCRWW